MSDDGEDRRARFAALSGLTPEPVSPEEARRLGVEDATLRAIAGHRLSVDALILVNGLAAMLAKRGAEDIGALQHLLFTGDPGRVFREGAAERAAADLSDPLLFPAAGNA